MKKEDLIANVLANTPDWGVDPPKYNIPKYNIPKYNIPLPPDPLAGETIRNTRPSDMPIPTLHYTAGDMRRHEDKALQILRNIPTQIGIGINSSLNVPKPIRQVAQIGNETYKFIMPKSIGGLILLLTLDPIGKAGEAIGESALRPLLEHVADSEIFKKAIIKAMAYGSAGATATLAGATANNNYKNIGNRMLINGAIGGALGGSSEYIPRLLAQVGHFIPREALKIMETIKAHTPKNVVGGIKIGIKKGAKITDNRLFNIFHAVPSAIEKKVYNILLHVNEVKTSASLAANVFMDTVEKNPGAVEAIGLGSNLYNSVPGFFNNGGLTEDLDILAKDYNLKPMQLKQLINIRKAYFSKDIQGALAESRMAYGKISDSLKSAKLPKQINTTIARASSAINKLKRIGKQYEVIPYIKSMGKNIDEIDKISKLIETKISVPEIARLRKLATQVGYKLSNSIDKGVAFADKQLASAKTIDSSTDNLRDKIVSDIEKRGHTTQASLNKAVLTNHLDINKHTDSLSTKVTQGITRATKRSDNIALNLQKKKDKIAQKINNIIQDYSDKIANIQHNITIPFDNYFSLADDPLNAIKSRIMDPQKLVERNAVQLERGDITHRLTKTWTHSDRLMQLQNLNDILAKSPIDENYWGAKLSDDTHLSPKDMRYVLRGLPQALFQTDNALQMLKQKLDYVSENPNNINIAKFIMRKIYENSHMSEGLTAGDISKGYNADFLQKFIHDSDTHEIYRRILGQSNEVNNIFDKAMTGIKRFRVALTPFHLFSLSKSAYYNGETPQRIFSLLRMGRPAFNKNMLATFNQARDILNKHNVNLATYIERPISVSFAKGGRIARIFLGNKYMKYMDNILWNKMYNAYKIDAIGDVASQLDKGNIQPAQAEKQLNIINSFFGGLPELSLRMPDKTKSLIRTLFFAPDWGMSLLKQMGYGVSLSDEKIIKYYHNMFIFNIMLRQAAQVYSRQPNSLTQLPNELSAPSSLFNTYSNNNRIDVLGYEKEYPNVILRSILALRDGGLNAGTLELLYELKDKLGVFPQVAMNLQQVIREKKPAISIVKPLLPFIASDFMDNPTASGVISSSVSNILGIRVHPLKYARGITAQYFSPTPLNKHSLAQSKKAVLDFYSHYAKSSSSLKRALVNEAITDINPYITLSLARIAYNQKDNPNVTTILQSEIDKFKTKYLYKLEHSPTAKEYNLPIFRWHNIFNHIISQTVSLKKQMERQNESR